MKPATEDPETRSPERESEQSPEASIPPAPSGELADEPRRWPWLYRFVDRLALGNRRALLARVGVAIVMLVGVVLITPSVFGWALAVAVTIVAVPFHRLHAYAIAFLPYGGAWLLFTVFRASADETAVPLRTEAVTSIERAMFFGTTPTIWLQNHLFSPLSLSWYDYATTFVHWSYFFVPHIAAIVIWRRNPQLFTKYLVATVLLLGVGLMVYFLAPAAPPWLTSDTAQQQDTYRVMANVGRQINSSLYDRTYSVVGDSNPVAAMPSMHQAITVLVAIFALRAGRWIGAAGVLYAVAMGYSLVYSGEHYAVDVLIGSGLALYAYYFAGRWLEMISPLFRTLRRLGRGEFQPASAPASR